MLNKNIHGFIFTKEEFIPELGATLCLGAYERTGTEIAYLKRADINKTFSIAFKTLPKDDTGVFHILEHSVLCGSRKYPVKEPFVELLKASLKTFLNAMTFPDKTMYPVSSRNHKDFLNLIEVYMDAVLHPLAVEDKNIFYQEGWHYEIDEEGKLSYNGVVFNEMKGAYSSADEVEMEKMSKLLYGGSVYGYDSGGDPEAIPTLTYEDFCAAHKKYYHPSNAKIFLDGDMDIEKVLAKLSSFLCEYESQPLPEDIGDVPHHGKIDATEKYEVSEGEEERGSRLCFGYRSHTWRECERAMAISIILDAIAGNNEAPLKKALLDSGLCEDAGFFPYDGIKESSVLFEIKNFKAEDEERLTDIYHSTLRKIIAEGIDKNALSAALSFLEFKTREQDGGGLPLGITYAISTLDTWLYGGEPADGLRFEGALTSLKSHLDDQGYFEKLLEELIFHAKTSAVLHLAPDSRAGKEKAAKERARLDAAARGYSQAELEKIKEEALALKAKQSAPDTKEALATLPYLTVEDIDEKPELIPAETFDIRGAKGLFAPSETKGITYLNLLFDISDLTPSDLSRVSLLTDLLTCVSTEGYTAAELQTKIKSDMGSLSLTTLTTKRQGETKIYLNLGASFLDTKEEEAAELIGEVILRSSFGEADVVKRIISQVRLGIYEAICQAGHAAALKRSGAYVDGESAASEYTSGIEYYKWIKTVDKFTEKERSQLCEELEELMKRIFVLPRLTLSYSGSKRASVSERIADMLPREGRAPEGCFVSPLGIKREGVIIPGGVSYAAMCNPVSEDMPGYMSVARSMLALGHLWGEVRVKGGAYGSGAIARNSGLFGYYSYRDPSPYRTLECFKACGEYLRELAKSDEDFTGFIIGAVGDSDTLITPKNRGFISLAIYLRGESYELRCKKRLQMLRTSKEDLLKAAKFAEAATLGGFCIVGSREILEKEKEKLDFLFEI